MKVVLVNGSRRESGCTYTALSIIAEVLHGRGIETEMYMSGAKVAAGAMDEAVAEVAQAVKSADAMIVGSPVYYASPSGEVISFMDRLYGVAGADLCHKPGAAIASARRAGTSATLDVLNKYFLYNQQPLVASNYWNMVHGSRPEDVLADAEGVQIMQTLGENMAWMLKCIEAGKAAGVETVPVKKIFTNFIR